MTQPHIPIYRFGTVYESLDTTTIDDFRGTVQTATVSQANPGMIRRDMKKISKAFAALQSRSTDEMIAIAKEAGRLYMEGTLPVDDTTSHSPDEYAATLSANSGLPLTLVRGNMEKVAYMLSHVEDVIHGLTRGLDHAVIDKGIAEQNGLLMSFFPDTQSLGAVLPSNSPGVNSLWIPAVVLRIPVVLKPGREDPWTPWRIIQAFLAAGCPPEAFGFYPTSHEGAAEVLNQCGRALVFGDQSTVDKYAGDSRISAHGPGWSKVIIAEDQADHWADYVDVCVDSIVRNGGRSCVNASCIVIPRNGRALADAIAKKLATVLPTRLDDPTARLAATANPRMADFLEQTLEQALKSPGATDLTTPARGTPIRTEVDGATFIQPTLVWCDDRSHTLANSELLMPYASVVEVPQDELFTWIGPTLVGTVITNDPATRQAAIACAHIDRLNLGPLPTPTVRWDQPHEGNLFEFLYRRRAIQESDEAPA